MKNIQREDIKLISRHSNMTEPEVGRLLKETVYNDKEMWQKFLRQFFIILGVGFATTGIIFFFAYNWADLHKFAKIGLTEVLITATTIIALLPKINQNTRNIILTGSAFLVGVLFAVFGQIYQTGANAYDFFLAWTLFIALWVAISNFAPLWLLFIVLINTTFILYTQQVAKDWDELLIVTIIFCINVIILISTFLLQNLKKVPVIPMWFTHILTLGCAVIATLGMMIVIFDEYKSLSIIFTILILTTYAIGIWHGLNSKNIFYLSVIPFSIISIISALLINFSTDGGMFLFVSLFVIGSVTMVIMNIINLQKKWKNEN
ncbi:DUF2157 domain-containing protein [Chryseobacterium indoltheticum]|uniref:Predicted membrane protein n=1 Tax=Chryseobacterium indoltheticum TaxID=254 RepID=A0A381F7Z1_9FLAO|nr:DUF2157 domain-containing protein [Chryseobacterium indoltheticum]AZA73079.1 DUF2157 domain-containing protein [Chryseobacterium indoltheticum]SIP93270.1 Predicted membrane protein [Chryseobacterium indoltheticum]SUX42691.1 Predicted membrane protein [Chryseobacterium indoltheticum]